MLSDKAVDGLSAFLGQNAPVEELVQSLAEGIRAYARRTEQVVDPRKWIEERVLSEAARYSMFKFTPEEIGELADLIRAEWAKQG